MFLLLISIFVIAVILAVIKLNFPHLLAGLGASDTKLTSIAVYVGTPLLTQAEKAFLVALDTAVDSQYRIFTKVRLADLVRPKASKSSGSKWRTAFNQIQSKHVDFVLCDPESMDVKFVVELDDRSHLRKDRADRDEFVDGVLKSVGLKVIRFVAKASYNPQDIAAKLHA
jgi:very-short-patch-repair endonuclease